MKTYQREACDKWFTSSGHLKRPFNTMLHKNATRHHHKLGGAGGVLVQRCIEVMLEVTRGREPSVTGLTLVRLHTFGLV